MESLSFLGQVLFGGFFVFMGLKHFMNTKKLSAYAASKNIRSPRKAVLAGGLLLLFGGFSVMLDAALQWGVLALILFLTAVSFGVHKFWILEDPAEREAQMGNFLKNMALIGASLMLL